MAINSFYRKFLIYYPLEHTCKILILYNQFYVLAFHLNTLKTLWSKWCAWAMTCFQVYWANLSIGSKHNNYCCRDSISWARPSLFSVTISTNKKTIFLLTQNPTLVSWLISALELEWGQKCYWISIFFIVCFSVKLKIVDRFKKKPGWIMECRTLNFFHLHCTA